MKRIGEIAARLAHNPVELVAAANKAPRKFGRQATEEGDSSLPDATVMGATKVAARSGREEQNGPPIAQAAEGTASELGKKKAGSGGDLARPVTGQVASGGNGVLSNQPRLRLVLPVGRDLSTATRRNVNGQPRPAVLKTLLIVGGTDHHARSVTRTSLR